MTAITDINLDTNIDNNAHLVFIDTSLDNYQSLIAENDFANVVLLDPNQDGIEQITQVLIDYQQNYQQFNSIQIFSHGNSGSLQLGSTNLNSSNLHSYRSELVSWSNSLKENGDILLFGCNLGAEATGLNLIDGLSQLTNADVAASDDLTGSSKLGGDWDLEVTTGEIEADVAISADTLYAYDAVLASYNGNDYQLTSSSLTWTQAQAEAESLGGNLVSINDADEEAWLKETFGEDEGFWIGINDAESEGNFEWVSGDPVTYTNWAPGEPNNYQQNQDYGRINFGATRQWDDAAAFVLFRGIIEFDRNITESGAISLETNSYQVNEADGTAEVTILRTQGSDGTVTVDYRTVDAAAIAGEDYSAVAGTVTFADGETSQTITIPLIDDDEVESDQDFSFTIDNVIGATLLAPRTALVNIEDNDSTTDGLTYNGNQYLLTSSSLTWTQAQAEAENLGGNLVSINDADEEAWLKKTFGKDEGFWIGINDAESEGNFEWVSGDPVTYTNWAPGEPNNYQQNQDYGRINFGATRQWDDAAVDVLFRGIIEVGGSNPINPIDGTGNGLRGEYFNNIDFTDSTLTRIDSTINFDWGSGSPDSAIANDTFSVRWTGEIASRFSETYTFRTTADDGVRLWINDQLIIDNLVEQSPTSNEGSIALVAGKKTNIRLEYYENSGDALAQLSWFSDRQALEIVPQSQLYSTIAPQPVLNNETVINGLSLPTAIEWTPNSDRFFIAEKNGVIKVSQNGELLDTPFIDLSDRVNGTRDRGLLDIAVHPDFFNGSPYVYALYTYDPPEVFQYSGLAGEDGNGNRAGRLTRITADPNTNFTTAIPGSEVVILGTNSTWENFNGFANSTNNFNEPPAGILADGTNLQDFLAADSESHSIGAVEFGPDGALYVSNGDGTSYNQVDHRSVRVQDIDNLSGKILRIDPITGDGLADNPFYNGDPNANRSKVYQLGLRNPFRITVDPRNGDVYVGDVGWTQWEEINSAGAGANFGWPYYEGGNGNSLIAGGYRDLTEAQTFYDNGESVEPSILALSHNIDGINAIVLGDIYTGNAFPEEYRGDLFFNDLGQGIVYNVNFDADGNVISFDTFTTGANIVVQIIQGPDGSLYYVDLDDGIIGRWFFS